MFRKRFARSAGLFTIALALAACGTGGDRSNELAALDEELIGNASEDPALTAALEDQIMVDPDLAQQSNRHAALPGSPQTGAPVPDTMRTSATMQREAQRAIAEGRLLTAPAPTRAEQGCTDCAASREVNYGYSAGRGETTLGALAERQGRAAPRGGAECRQNVVYGMQWADLMPRAFTVYPGAEVIEAAGKNEAHCRLRVVSFAASAPMERLINWYYTRAVRTGYSAEHQIRNGNHVLGGYRERDEGAFFIIFANHPNGGTAVDIVANNGR